MSRFAHDHTPLLDSPPPCVLAEVDAAWERASEPLVDGLELHFALGSVAGSLRCSLRAEDGSIVAPLSACEALALACGDVVFAVTA
jgi:hypothetical protein